MTELWARECCSAEAEDRSELGRVDGADGAGHKCDGVMHLYGERNAVRRQESAYHGRAPHIIAGATQSSPGGNTYRNEGRAFNYE